MRKLSVIGLLLLLLSGACSKAPESSYRGKKMLQDKKIKIDSLLIDADTTSMRGSFLLLDSSLIFVDQHYCAVYEFAVADGTLNNVYSRRGQGPDDMLGIMYGCKVAPQDTALWIVDSSIGVFEMNMASDRGKPKHIGRINFHWDNADQTSYEGTALYNLLEMSDFGIKMCKIDDSTLLIPLSLINRKLSAIDSKRYKEGHIFGVVDIPSLDVKEVTGLFSESFLKNPTPNFEFFDYDIDYSNGKVYVSFAPDSLIQCYDISDLSKPLYYFGFEPNGINREYTAGYKNREMLGQIWGHDIEKVGVNTGLYFDNTDKLLMRTSMTDFASGRTVLQIYSNDNLIGEYDLPPYFKILGRYGNRYYGVRFIPVETADECNYTLYSFTL